MAPRSKHNKTRRCCSRLSNCQYQPGSLSSTRTQARPISPIPWLIHCRGLDGDDIVPASAERRTVHHMTTMSSGQISQAERAWHTLSVHSAIEDLDTATAGLDSAEAARRLLVHG